MFYTDIDRGLDKERVAHMLIEVEHNRLEARLVREARLAKAAGLSEEARLAKARLSEGAVLPRRGIIARSAALITSAFR